MATTYYIYAGKELVEDFDVPSTDSDFMGFISEIKSKLSDEAKLAFNLFNEYEFDDEDPEMPTCTDDVYAEIERAILTT